MSQNLYMCERSSFNSNHLTKKLLKNVTNVLCYVTQIFVYIMRQYGNPIDVLYWCKCGKKDVYCRCLYIGFLPAYAETTFR